MRPSFIKLVLITLLFSLNIFAVSAIELKINEPAPLFKSKLHDGSDFDLFSRKGKWTVLYFFPKAGTPGCTKQAIAFRDNIEKIRKRGAEVYGISSDSVAEQAKFHNEQQLNFPLIADPEKRIIGQYGTKMPLMSMSKRWTFIIDPALVIREIEKDVDAASDYDHVVSTLSKLAESNKSKK